MDVMHSPETGERETRWTYKPIPKEWHIWMTVINFGYRNNRNQARPLLQILIFKMVECGADGACQQRRTRAARPARLPAAESRRARSPEPSSFCFWLELHGSDRGGIVRHDVSQKRGQ